MGYMGYMGYGPLWCIQFPDIMGTIKYYGHMFHSEGVSAMAHTPMAAPGDGGIGPYLHRFRRFILFAWGPLLSEISGDRKKMSQLCWTCFTWLERVGTNENNGKKKHGIVGELFVKDCSETTGNCCCFIEWRCVWDITSFSCSTFNIAESVLSQCLWKLLLQPMCSWGLLVACHSYFQVHIYIYMYMIIGIKTYIHHIYNIHTGHVHLYVIYHDCSFLNLEIIYHLSCIH